ncbi:TPA: hypothetical protein ACGEPX_003909 [Salmonella enterica]|nr:hypothetical protein [Salmonella enterica]
MTTITRERLLKIQQWRETYGTGSNVMLPAEEAEELARIALASLEVAPVGEVSEKRHGLVMDGTVDLGGKSTYRIIKGEKAMKRLPLGTKFYIAPPAPVVPDDGRAEFEAWMLKKWGRERQEYDFAMGKFLHGENYADSYTRHMWKAWTESRAAMLQSKYRDLSQPVDPQISEYEKIMLRAGNSPVTPDGYTLVPVDLTPEMREAFHVANEEYESGHYDVWSPDHQWQAMLAAAPQQ